MTLAAHRVLAIALVATLLAGGGWSDVRASVPRDELSGAECACQCGGPERSGPERCGCCRPVLEGTEASPPTSGSACICRAGEFPPLMPGGAPVELRLRGEVPGGLAAAPVQLSAGIGAAQRDVFIRLHGAAAAAPPVRVLFCTWLT